MRTLRFLLPAIGAFALAGCVSSVLAHKVVSPPNKSGVRPLFADLELIKRAPDAFADTWLVAVAQPRADIAVAAVEPGDYAFEYDLALDYPDGKVPNISRFHAYWRPAAEVVRYPGPPKGTVILLHGYLQNRNSVTPWAVRLAQAGFRCAVVDLRGHGTS